MPIKVISISPPGLRIRNTSDTIATHKAIEVFEWVNEKTQGKGKTSREAMYNWIVNQGGSAFINIDSENIFLFGAATPLGEHYIRAAKNGNWTDDLLSLSAKPDTV